MTRRICGPSSVPAKMLCDVFTTTGMLDPICDLNRLPTGWEFLDFVGR